MSRLAWAKHTCSPAGLYASCTGPNKCALTDSALLCNSMKACAHMSLQANGMLIAQEMRTYKQAEEAGKVAGLELVTSIDIAVASSVAGPW